MLKVERKMEGEVTSLTLSGVIDERVDFAPHIEPVTGALRLDLRRIERINSVGVKNWVRYFSDLRKKGTELMLADCSPQIVEQINLVSNFSCGAKIESILAPFRCGSCGGEVLTSFTLTELKAMNGVFPEPPCPKCQAKTAFDDIEEEYLSFLSRPGT